ncbi:MAG: hypothetical protein CML68_00310 [Rhodobacteraceae bacterium]|nr:hypothetical protein [Paracoccaceae bacterium]
MIELSVTCIARPGATLIAPVGLSTPDAAVTEVTMTGGSARLVADPLAGLHVLAIRPEARELRLTYRFQRGGAAYPEAIFTPRDSRYTRSADALATEARQVALAAGGGSAAIRALANHVAGQFRYGHPEERYYEGHDEIPQLCGLTEGSCVDINAYFIACCRAAGLQAGYVTGAFVPEEKRDWCEDMHCWVVTRSDAGVQEWDIAHHLKLGRADIAPGLNPKPGVRVPLAHSMGLNFPALGVADLKLIGEPMWLTSEGTWLDANPRFQLAGYELLAA